MLGNQGNQEKEVRKIKIDEWSVDHIKLDSPFDVQIPVIRGLVNGKYVQTGAIYWLDINEKIAMTDKDIFELGSVNKIWYQLLLGNGARLEDIQIKSTNH